KAARFEWVKLAQMHKKPYNIKYEDDAALLYKFGGNMDEIDKGIIKALQQDARTSFAELGRRVGLTTPAVIERVRKLEDAGIITGYRAVIDTAKVGLPITAFVRMSITGVDYSHIIEVAESSAEVLECHRGTGGDSFIMKVAVASVDHLQQVIDRL